MNCLLGRKGRWWLEDDEEWDPERGGRHAEASTGLDCLLSYKLEANTTASH